MIPPIYEMVASSNKNKIEKSDFDAQAIKISGGNKPNKDSEIRKMEKITKGEQTSTKLVSTEPISTIKESTTNNNKTKMTAIIPPLKAVLLIKV